MPVDDGAAGQVLSTDGGGILNWAASSSSLVINFAETYTTTPIVVITLRDAIEVKNINPGPYLSASSTTGFTITADAAYDGSTWNWIAIGT